MPRVPGEERWADGLTFQMFDIIGSQQLKSELLEMNVFACAYIKR